MPVVKDPIQSSSGAREMSDQPLNKVFGLSPARFGITSLISACLAWASIPLIVVVGVFLAHCVFAPLVMTSVVTGLTVVGAGIYYKNPVAILTATLGLLLVVCLGAFLSNAMSF
jgi:hypothetical protein